MKDICRKAFRRAVFYSHQVSVYARLCWLALLNRFGGASLVGPGGPVVSLTTYGRRAQTVHLAIESIGRGRLQPSRLILWIDEQSLADHLPAGVRRLQKRGLEVRLCANLGPHTKYYPYLEASQTLEAPLVTADDDLLYPCTWLERLLGEFYKHPDVVNCYRARVIPLDGQGFANYSEWPLARSTGASFRHFALGVAGAVYPIPLQRALKREGPAFMELCPKADDVWLHVQAIRAGYKIRQIEEREFRLTIIPRTQDVALWKSNVFGGNDGQVRATYTQDDIRILRDDALPSHKASESVVEAKSQKGDRDVMNAARITVGVCTFNRKGMLEQALRSLSGLRANQMIEFEILVVDDASPDDSYSMCCSIQACSRVPMRVIKHERNSGVAVSRNTCVRNATGDWIAFFDDDEIAHPDWLVNLYETAVQSGADCVGGPCRLLDANQDLPQSLRRLVSENPVMQRSLPRRFALDPRRRQNAMAAAMGTGNVLIRRSMFDEVGMFSERRRRGEDIEFFLRAYKAGALFAVAPDAIIYHVIPPERLSPENLRRSARSGGANLGEIEMETLGRLRTWWNGVMRLAHLGLVTIPGLLRAYVLRDHADLLGWQCKARFAVAYLCAIAFPNPNQTRSGAFE